MADPSGGTSNDYLGSVANHASYQTSAVASSSKTPMRHSTATAELLRTLSQLSRMIQPGTQSQEPDDELREAFPLETDREEPVAVTVEDFDASAVLLHDVNRSVFKVANEETQRHEATPAGPSSASRRIALPDLSLNLEDEMRRKRWTSEKLQSIIADQQLYYRFGINGSMRDVAASLFPVECGLISEDRAPVLLAA
jgi:hypothetical protein